MTSIGGLKRRLSRASRTIRTRVWFLLLPLTQRYIDRIPWAIVRFFLPDLTVPKDSYMTTPTSIIQINRLSTTPDGIQKCPPSQNSLMLEE